MASNAAEREILFTELQVSGGVPPGAAPAPLCSLAGRMEAPPRPAAPCPPLPARRSARGAHPTPRPGRGGGGSPCPPQASSRCSPPRPEAPPPGHGPTPLPAATRFCLRPAPSFPPPSGRVPPAGPAPGRAPRPGQGPAGWGAPSAPTELPCPAGAAGPLRCLVALASPRRPGHGACQGPGRRGSGSHPSAGVRVRERALPL